MAPTTSGAWDILNSKTILDAELACLSVSVEGEGGKHADAYLGRFTRYGFVASNLQLAYDCCVRPKNVIGF